MFVYYDTILLTKTTAAQNEVALSYHRVRGLYFLAVVFVATILLCLCVKVLDVVGGVHTCNIWDPGKDRNTF